MLSSDDSFVAVGGSLVVDWLSGSASPTEKLGALKALLYCSYTSSVSKSLDGSNRTLLLKSTANPMSIYAQFEGMKIESEKMHKH